METGSSVKTILKLPGKKDFFTQEAFKTLRTNLQFCGQDICTVVITSCNENEGKTTITLQLAKSLAELNKRVLVIDADMRKSVMAGRNTTAENPAGLSEVLTGLTSVKECLYQTQYDYRVPADDAYHYASIRGMSVVVPDLDKIHEALLNEYLPLNAEKESSE